MESLGLSPAQCAGVSRQRLSDQSCKDSLAHPPHLTLRCC
jgi:hypothetical protein